MKASHFSKVFILLFLISTLVTRAQVVTSFNKIYQVTQKGGIVFLSNVSVGCSANPPTTGNSACMNDTNENPPLGTYADNNFASVYVDVDGDAATFMLLKWKHNGL